jgi:ketosteroid isomerase-like protein
MSENPTTGPSGVLERMQRALNDRDLEAYVACYSPDYRSEQPIHPEWTYTGRDQLRWNWTGIFENVRDFRAELLRHTIDGDCIWSEWRWTGVQPDDMPMVVVGVIIMGVENDQIAWGRIYMESEAGGRLSFNEGRARHPERMDA